ncbi:restriction endonuclease subunit S [Frigidibacter oleivorans]|uniref:restriction endonuclease subunit S n=1 Tax=Frigidibacter oleivorans TaxID=2487129 RepID=UPI000F8D9C01|nr:restriction endonuclease subunit S [Frigidibacter oleivorans]
MADTTMRLSDLCDLVGVQVDPANYANGVYIGLEHVASGRFVRFGEGEASDVQSGKYLFQSGDVLYGKLRPYLDKAVLAADTGICTTELLVLRPKEGVDPRFLVGVVHAPTFIEHAVSGTTGVQHPRTSWGHIANYELPAFDSREQVKIANLLWEVHDAITANEAAIEAGGDLKRAAMRALFTKGLQGETQKETEIGPVPGSWDVGRLDRYATIISTRMSYSELENIDPSNDGETVKVLGIKVADMNLPGNEVELVSAKLEKDLPRAIAEYRCAPPRTIIFPKRGAAIATNKKRIANEWTAFDPNVIGVIGGTDLDQDFLFHWFQTFDLKTITEPGPTPQLNKKNLEPLTIPVPPTLDEQREIVGILDAIDRKIDLHRRKRGVLDKLFKALLHKLMTGEIRVSDLDLSALSSDPAASPKKTPEVAA